jgi:hypothetical protein
VTRDRLAIAFSGMLAATPGQGGATWAVLQYVLGLKRLGHRVCLVEPVSADAQQPGDAGLARSPSAAYFAGVVDRFDLRDDAALLLAGTRRTLGLPYDRLIAIAHEADVLINVSGMLTDPALLEPIPTRVYLDLDPAFNQLWQLQGIDMRFAGHTHFATVGLAIGADDCRVPTGGIDWITTTQPVVLSEWPVAERVEWDALTTIANWRGYGSIEHEGVLYGQKAHSLRRFMDLPTRTDERLVLALSIHPDETSDLTALAANGWELVDPATVADTPDAYRRFVQGSKAELGVAKSGYVLSRSGWFSDRSVCYLASGRPVVAQETGFSRYLPSGAGLLAFETGDDALAAIEELRRDYRRHRRAARALAEAHFDSDRVLTDLLARVGAA